MASPDLGFERFYDACFRQLRRCDLLERNPETVEPCLSHSAQAAPRPTLPRGAASKRSGAGPLRFWRLLPVGNEGSFKIVLSSIPVSGNGFSRSPTGTQGYAVPHRETSETFAGVPSV